MLTEAQLLGLTNTITLSDTLSEYHWKLLQKGLWISSSGSEVLPVLLVLDSGMQLCVHLIGNGSNIC